MTCPKHGRANRKEGELSCRPRRNIHTHTQHLETHEKAFSSPNRSNHSNYHVQTQPGWPTSGVLMVSITSRFTRTSLLFSLQPALRKACVMLSGMRQEQERCCGRDSLMIKGRFHADSHAETCMTLPFPAAE